MKVRLETKRDDRTSAHITDSKHARAGVFLTGCHLQHVSFGVLDISHVQLQHVLYRNPLNSPHVPNIYPTFLSVERGEFVV